MKCAGCQRTLEPGERYIQFTQTEWAEKNGVQQLGEEFDGLFATIMGSELGDKIVYCEDCTEESDNGWMQDMVYGDEASDERSGTWLTAPEWPS